MNISKISNHRSYLASGLCKIFANIFSICLHIICVYICKHMLVAEFNLRKFFSEDAMKRVGGSYLLNDNIIIDFIFFGVNYRFLIIK